MANLSRSDPAAARRLETLFTPADFARLPERDLRGATCVVFDVLRATSSMVTALAHGAREIFPVADIAEALARRRARPELLLAGERDGRRIGAARTGGVEFDLGNSPREFRPEVVAGRSLVMTTTNGTRALRACAGAARVYGAAFLNLGTLVARLQAAPPEHLLVVCGGTFEEAALEDALAAGALLEALWPRYAAGHVSDAAVIARALFHRHGRDLPRAFRLARNGRRLLEQPALREDVAFCARRDVFAVLPALEGDRLVALNAP
jgi:2-phosphosulfolactate phosphatase